MKTPHIAGNIVHIAVTHIQHDLRVNSEPRHMNLGYYPCFSFSFARFYEFSPEKILKHTKKTTETRKKHAKTSENTHSAWKEPISLPNMYNTMYVWISDIYTLAAVIFHVWGRSYYFYKSYVDFPIVLSCYLLCFDVFCCFFCCC